MKRRAKSSDTLRPLPVTAIQHAAVSVVVADAVTGVRPVGETSYDETELAFGALPKASDTMVSEPWVRPGEHRTPQLRTPAARAQPPTSAKPGTGFRRNDKPRGFR